MNYERIAQLYAMLAEEEKKTPLNDKRIKEINHYLSVELGTAPPKPQHTGSWFDGIWPLPDNWKTYVTSAIGAFVALNSQVHLVSQNWQDGLLAAAVALGFWAVNSTQALNLEKVKKHVAMVMLAKK